MLLQQPSQRIRKWSSPLPGSAAPPQQPLYSPEPSCAPPLYGEHQCGRSARGSDAHIPAAASPAPHSACECNACIYKPQDKRNDVYSRGRLKGWTILKAVATPGYKTLHLVSLRAQRQRGKTTGGTNTKDTIRHSSVCCKNPALRECQSGAANVYADKNEGIQGSLRVECTSVHVSGTMLVIWIRDSLNPEVFPNKNHEIELLPNTLWREPGFRTLRTARSPLCEGRGAQNR